MSAKLYTAKVLAAYGAMGFALYCAQAYEKEHRAERARAAADPVQMQAEYCSKVASSTKALHTKFSHRAIGEAKDGLFEITEDDCKTLMNAKKAAVGTPAP